MEFQKSKLHPVIRKHLEGGTCIQYGARVINEGGMHYVLFIINSSSSRPFHECMYVVLMLC
jgi:flavin-dependent dehydrogenase